MLVVACGSTAPSTEAKQQNLEQQAQMTLRSMIQRDPSLTAVLDQSAGYAVFPEIAKGGLVAGAASGRGVLYQNGQMMGFVRLSQASIGAQVGGQTFSELVAFQDDFHVQRLKRGEFSLGANASAVVLKSGAGAAAQFRDGVAVFVVPRGGAMAELSISGQRISFEPTSG